MVSNPVNEKKELRKWIREQKSLYSEKQKKEWSALLFRSLEELEIFQKASRIMLYWSLPDEVFTHDFILKWYRKKTIFLPVIKDNQLRIKQFTGPEQMHPGTLNIPEPADEEYADSASPDLIIVPGMAFDGEKNRLGRGKAYYDRFLQGCPAYKIGVCFPFQRVERVPVGSQDVRMDLILAGQELI